MDFRQKDTAIDLNGVWGFAYSETPPKTPITCVADLQKTGLPFYSGVVPGNFELDLQRNGVIDDPFFGMNIAHLRHYERAHIWYYRKFRGVDFEGRAAFLVFQGIDCFAEIYLNGESLGHAQNALIEHRFELDYPLREENEILIRIDPPNIHTDFHDIPANLYAPQANYESLYVRKAPHSYGWDIMPRALSAGMWRPIRIELLPQERLFDVALDTLSLAADHSTANLRLKVQANVVAILPDSYRLEIEGRCGESVFHAEGAVLSRVGALAFSVPNPALWWCRGRGEQNLYEVEVRLFKNDTLLDSLSFHYGIRTIELLRTSVTDAKGSGEFCFKLNGERVFIMGSNWVPVDAYHSRDKERIPAILDMAEDIGCNMLRCWGGNVYEDDLFYEICDEKGILVWQDFAMACGVYPQDNFFCTKLRQEARGVVRRLRLHPCIALWGGDNECDQAYSWGGIKRDPNQNVLTRQVLPRLLNEEDPLRPYLPSSPYIDSVAYKAGEAFLPESHLWGPRDYYKSDYYTQSLCHFASEMGYHGCPSPESIRKFISPEKVWHYKDNEEWILHSTSPIPGVDLFDYRVELMEKQVRELFGEVPDNLEDYAFASQASQAEAKKFFVEMFRTAKWRRTGVLWWNLMDGWPQFSDAVVDYYFCKKLAYHFIRRSQQPLILTLREPKNWRQEIVACNDTRLNTPLTYRIEDAETGETMAEGRGTAAADKTTVLGSLPYSASWKRFYLLTWESEQGTGENHYLTGNPPFNFNTYRECLKKAGF